MSRAGKPRSRVRDFLALAGAGLLPVPWMVVHHYPGLGLAPELVALLSGLAILGGAFLLGMAATRPIKAAGGQSQERSYAYRGDWRNTASYGVGSTTDRGYGRSMAGRNGIDQLPEEGI